MINNEQQCRLSFNFLCNSRIRNNHRYFIFYPKSALTSPILSVHSNDLKILPQNPRTFKFSAIVGDIFWKVLI